MEAAEPEKGIQDLTGTRTNRKRHCCGISIFIFIALLLVIFAYQLPPALAVLGDKEYTAGIPANFPPQYQVDAKTGKPYGFAIDVMDEIARRSGIKVRYVVYGNFSDVMVAMQKGEIDLIPNVGITDERKKYTDFTAPVETFHIHIFVRSTTDDIKNIDDLTGRKVAVVSENQGYTIMKARNRSQLLVYNSMEEALMSLISGNADAMVYPDVPILLVARQSGIEDQIKTTGDALAEIKRTIGVRKGQPELFNKLDETTKAFITTPEYEQIYAKWYGKPEPYWNTQRVLAALGITIVLVAAIFFVFHYFSVIGLNKKLREVNELFALFMRHSPIYAYIKEVTPTESRVIQASENFNQMIGIPGSNMVGKTMAELFPPEFAAKITADDWAVTSGGKMLKHVEILNCRIYDTIKFPLVMGDKTLLAGYTIDITERKKDDEILHASLRLSEYALTHSLDELLTMTLDEAELLTGSKIGFFHFLEADQKTLLLQSWSTNTLQNMCTAEGKGKHYPLDEAGVWVDAVRKRRPVIHNDYASLPNRKGLPSGHAPVIRELVFPIIRGGLVIGILGVGNKPGEYDEQDIEISSRFGNTAWDIILAKRAEDALRESEAHYHFLVEGTPGIVYSFSDRRGGIYYSSHVEDILGYSREHLYAHPMLWHDSIHPDDLPRVDEITRQLPIGKVFHIEYRICDAKGNWRWFDDRFIEQHSNNGEAIVTGLALDITERKLAESLIVSQREMALSLGDTSELEEGLRRFLDKAIQVSEMDCGGIYLVDESSGALDLVFHTGLPLAFVNSASHYETDSENARLVMKGKPVSTRHYELGVPLPEDRLQEQLKAIAIIPFHHKGHVIGCLNIASHTLDEVPDFAFRALELLTAQFGATIARLRAEKEIRKLNTELEQRIEERTLKLSSLLKEKETLLKEVHHRVKNNLQIISSILQLQSTYMKDKQAVRAFGEAKNRVNMTFG